MAEGHAPLGTNRLLSTLPPEVYREIAPHLEQVSLGLRQILYESRKPAEYVYFPIHGVMYMPAEMEEDSLVEVATFGNGRFSALPRSHADAGCRLFPKSPATLYGGRPARYRGNKQCGTAAQITSPLHTSVDGSDFAGRRVQSNPRNRTEMRQIASDNA